MTEALPIAEASARLDELVRRTRAGDEHVILTEHDTPVAAIVSIETLRELQQAQDEADIALCRQSEAGPGPRLTHDEFMGLLDAEDTLRS
jgi:prevent-host-death family protein